MANLTGMFQLLNQGLGSYGESLVGAPSNLPLEQQNAMQRAGINNPLLQRLGMGLGSSLGKDMSSPADKVKQVMSGIDPNDPQAVLKIAAAIKDVDPVKSAQLIAEYQAAVAKAKQGTATFSGNERFKDPKTGEYFWVVQARDSRGGVQNQILSLDNQPIDPARIKDLVRVDSEGLTAQEKLDIANQQGFAEANFKFYSSMQDQIGASAAKDSTMAQLEKKLENPDFDMNTWTAYGPDILSTDETLAYRQLRNRLGLDVVGSTTFGALSAGELSIALATAMPNFTNREEALKWVQEKRRVEKKLRNEMIWASNRLLERASANQVRQELMERSDAVGELTGTGVKIQEREFTQAQWDATKANRNLNDDQLRELLTESGFKVVIK